MGVRLGIDKSNCIVLTDVHGNVITTVTNVSHWIDMLVHMKTLQEANEVMGTQIGTDGVAL